MNLRAMLSVAALAVAGFVFTPAAVHANGADDVRVTFANGRVTIAATNATVLEILREWSRAGGSTFVDAEKMPSSERLTLLLENETETRALQVLLRAAAGYVAVPRTAGMRGPSTIGRVVIMPVSNVANYAQMAPAPQQAMDVEPSPRFAAGPPQPDDDGPTRQTMPPAANPNDQTSTAIQQAPGALGQASPLQGTTTQTVPGLGAVTTSQPGAVIPNPSNRNPRSPLPVPFTPTQPIRRPGGGG